jgi:hypothetical protein
MPRHSFERANSAFTRFTKDSARAFVIPSEEGIQFLHKLKSTGTIWSYKSCYEPFNLFKSAMTSAEFRDVLADK